MSQTNSKAFCKHSSTYCNRSRPTFQADKRRLHHCLHLQGNYTMFPKRRRRSSCRPPTCIKHLALHDMVREHWKSTVTITLPF